MSLLREEDFGSDSDDEDYVPENEAGAEGGSSEELSGDDEGVDGGDVEKVKRRGKKKSRASKNKSVAQGSGLFGKSKEEIAEERERREEFAKEIDEKREENEKKRMEDLWADFKKDVGSKSSEPSATTKATVQDATASSGSSVVVKKPEVSTLTATTTLSEVKMPPTKATPATSDLAAPSTKLESKPTPAPAPVKRGSGLAGLVSAIADKKKKVGCLEQSKKDWNSFVQEKGIGEELQTFNRGKDGYVEKQNFLERADLRQFEREKEAREKMRKLQNR